MWKVIIILYATINRRKKKFSAIKFRQWEQAALLNFGENLLVKNFHILYGR